MSLFCQKGGAFARYFNLTIASFALMISTAYSQSPHVVIADNPNTINNQLSAPSVFVFPPYIQTIGQAISEVLKLTEYRLSQHIPADIQKILNQPLPMAQRRLEAMSVYSAIRTLTGAQIFMITPETKVISFSFDQGLSAMDLKPKVITSSLQNFLNRTHFNLRIAAPLADSGLQAQKQAIIDWYNATSKTSLYFGFNDTDQVVGIAATQKEADYLAKKDIAVFYAKAGQTVSQTIEQWLKPLNIKLYWQLKDDLTIEQASVFFGALKATDGALMQLLHAANQAGLHARAVFSANDALVVKPKVYSSLFLGDQK